MPADRPDRPNRRDDRPFGGRPGGAGGRPGGGRPSGGGGRDRSGGSSFGGNDRPRRDDRPNYGGGDNPNRSDRPDFRGGDRQRGPGPSFGGDRQESFDRPKPPFRPGGQRPGGFRPDRGGRPDQPRSNDWRPSGPRFGNSDQGGRDNNFSNDRPPYQGSDRHSNYRENKPPFQPRPGERRGASAPYKGDKKADEAFTAHTDLTDKPVDVNITAKGKTKAPTPRVELPTISDNGEFEELDTEEMVYIAYGEMGEDVAFDTTDDLSEGIMITNQMRDDGFEAKLFQGRVIYIPNDEE